MGNPNCCLLIIFGMYFFISPANRRGEPWKGFPLGKIEKEDQYLCISSSKRIKLDQNYGKKVWHRVRFTNLKK